MADGGDLHASTEEFAGEDAAYEWWRNAHPAGYVLAVRARKEPMLHRSRCKDVDRDVKRGALTAKGSRQICAASAQALRGWLAREMPEASQVLARCPKCAP